MSQPSLLVAADVAQGSLPLADEIMAVEDPAPGANAQAANEIDQSTHAGAQAPSDRSPEPHSDAQA